MESTGKMFRRKAWSGARACCAALVLLSAVVSGQVVAAPQGGTAEAGEQRRAEPQAPGSIAVVYPVLGEPYHSIFATIIEGIEDNARSAMRTYPVAANTDPAELNAQLKRNGAKVVIALGRQGLRATSALDRELPVVAGGVLAVPEADSRTMTAVSLTPDPALLFSRLKNLLPGTRRVIVVYNPQNNEWLIRLAREAARAQGLELVAHEARDLASAARLYEHAFAASDSKRDAIWLPQDATTVDETTILPLVLKESWNRNIALFSSSFLHVKKGALFALYPDNLELGRTLAWSAIAYLTGEQRRRGMLPLRDVHIAVNVRTAGHLGLSLSYQQQRTFDAVFPEP
ncbi:ABC transporter substrate-binding protein [Noviherbaspirillum aerium]|uniref:ABC transporter substrate-binding protein n=1 Tax=Noviherbaspirillum aerium TaxID=2588497 RepID=UPI001CEFA803|nr:ABC transporter substrate binding protein [Noviherbaspirillum aerium]